jgi:hypothetical protein
MDNFNYFLVLTIFEIFKYFIHKYEKKKVQKGQFLQSTLKVPHKKC